MNISTRLLIVLSLALVFPLTGCASRVESHEQPPSETHGAGHEAAHGEGHGEEHGEDHAEGEHEHEIVVTSPLREDVINTQEYVCQIHSCQHIEVRILEEGYLEEIDFKEGQFVKKGDMLFKVLPTLYKAKWDTEVAEANRIQIEYDNAQNLNEKGIVSPQELAIKKAELAKAKAKVELAKAELDFCERRAPFDGIVDRQRHQLGSLVEVDDILTTLSDNSLMWVYFNVPEAHYLEYKSKDNSDIKIELKLANGEIFPQPGTIGAIEADFNNTTGNIAFRADFKNPKGLLRNGQTGTILLHSTLKHVIVIPQRATFEILARRYAYVVDKDNVVHQRDISILGVHDDIFVIDSGLEEGEKIILEGIRQVRDGEKIDYVFRDPKEVLSKLKYHAE
jgi:membrane fusion protein (multidrug efflux system)